MYLFLHSHPAPFNNYFFFYRCVTYSLRAAMEMAAREFAAGTDDARRLHGFLRRLHHPIVQTVRGDHHVHLVSGRHVHADAEDAHTSADCVQSHCR